MEGDGADETFWWVILNIEGGMGWRSGGDATDDWPVEVVDVKLDNEWGPRGGKREAESESNVADASEEDALAAGESDADVDAGWFEDAFGWRDEAVLAFRSSLVAFSVPFVTVEAFRVIGALGWTRPPNLSSRMRPIREARKSPT